MKPENIVVDSLYKIMCTATSSVSDSKVTNNDYFKRRVLGFRAEYEFEQVINKYQKYKFIEGGSFLSKKLSGEKNIKNKFTYFTVCDYEQDIEEYALIYEKISKWDEVEELIIFKFSSIDEWGETDIYVKDSSESTKRKDKILLPSFEIFSYEKSTNSFIRHKFVSYEDALLSGFTISERSPAIFPLRKREQFDYFLEYNLKTLSKIYATRFILDVVLRKAQGRQIIDFDGFLIDESSSITLVEIKEKAPIQRDILDESSWQFGWDTRRILWYLYVMQKIGFDCLYCIKQITDRETREFVRWNAITISEYLKSVSWSNSRAGGGGEDTLLSPYTAFRDLEEVL